MIDIPGKKSLVSNAVKGITIADIGIVVISADKEQFEVEWGKDGSVRDQIIMAYALGVKELIVAVNKMDS